MSELRECPMCSGEASISHGHAMENVWAHGKFYRAYCGSCQLRQLFYRTEAEAIAAWNRRASPVQAEPVAWLIDWLDEPELGHYFAEAPSDTGRSRPLFAHPPSRNDAELLDWLDAAYRGMHKHAPYFGDGLWRFPYLVSGDGGYGGGVGEATFNTLREAIGAAMSAEGSQG